MVSSPFDGIMISYWERKVNVRYGKISDQIIHVAGRPAENKMYPDQVIRDFMWGLAVLLGRSLPAPNHPRGHRLSGSPHERLGGRAVDPARLPSHVPALGSPLDFHQTHGQGLVLSLVAVGVSVPEEERLVDARGEGDPQHLPRLRSSHPLSVSIYYYIPEEMSTPF